MNTRVRIASAVLVLLAVAATGARAEKADTSASPAPPMTHRASLGGQIGTPWIVAGGDYAAGAKLRLSFSGAFRYAVSPGLRWQVSPYFGWNGYDSGEPAPFADPNFPADATKEHYLTEIAGGSAQLQWTRTRGRTLWHLGGGPAIYRVVLENRRKVVADPVSFVRHHTTHLGATAEIGIERFLKNLTTTSLEATLAYQTVFATDDTKFPSGWNDNPGALELRVGGHYYYDLNRKKPEGKPGLRK